MGMVLRSPAFPEFGWIPERYAVNDPAAASPPLVWWDAPDHTGSFAIVCDDLDAIDSRVVRWAVCDIPSTKRAIAEAYPVTARTAYTRQGTNDFGVIGYSGDSPRAAMERPRHLRFRLFAVRGPTLGCAAGESARVMLARAAREAVAMAQLVGVRAAAPSAVSEPRAAAPSEPRVRSAHERAHHRASPG